MNTLETTASLVLVAIIWGFTNPFMKRGSAGIEAIHSSSAVWQFVSELQFLVSNWKYMCPFLLNLSGSVIYYIAIESADLSMAVPLANSLTFIFTTVMGRFLGETVDSKSTYLGMLLVVAGVSLCVLDRTWNAQDKQEPWKRWMSST